MQQGERRTGILYLHSSSDMYGSDRSLLRTIRALDRREFSPIVCLPYKGTLATELLSENVETFVFRLAILRRKSFSPFGILVFLFDLLVSTVRICHVCRRKGIGIVHSNTCAVLAGGIASRMLGIKHLWHVREIVVSPPVVRKLISFMIYIFSTEVIVVSKSVLDNLMIDQPRMGGKTSIIHNGIEIGKYQSGDRKHVRDRLQLSTEQVLIGMVGRISSWKGQDLFVTIAKKLSGVYGSVHFISVGSPFKGQDHLMARFLRRVDEEGLTNRLSIVAFTEKIQDYFAAFDIFLMPSTLPDPFPTVVLEAMAMRKAIIANAHGGVVEMIENGKSGFLVTPNRADEFVTRIETLIQRRDLASQFGNAAYERVSVLFSFERYCNEIAARYKTLCL